MSQLFLAVYFINSLAAYLLIMEKPSGGGGMYCHHPHFTDTSIKTKIIE